MGRLDSISKERIREIVPSSAGELKDIINSANPAYCDSKMVLGLLTSICAESMDPEPFILAKKLDYAGMELEKGTLVIKGDAGDGAGTAMKGGRIVIEGNAGEETGKSMIGGELEAREIKSVGNTLGGVIRAKKIGSIGKNQHAEIYIDGKRYKKSLIDKLTGR